MTKFVKEHDNGQNKQKRNHITDEAAAEIAQASDDFHTHYRLVLPLRALCATREIPMMPLRQFRARGPGPHFLQYGQWTAPHQSRPAPPLNRVLPPHQALLQPAPRWLEKRSCPL